MKHQYLYAPLLALTLLAGTAAQAGGNHDHKPLHGGIVAEASDLDFELLLSRPGQLTLYVRDHGKPLPLNGASARLTLLSGADKREALLAPVGSERLEAQGDFKLAAGSKVVALVQLPGRKPVNVRFALK
ncbi:MAG: hypothetical protein ACOVLH_10240 [Roseateles sp.]